MWVVLILLFLFTPLVANLYENFFIRGRWLKDAQLGGRENLIRFSEIIKGLSPLQAVGPISTPAPMIPAKLCQEFTTAKSNSSKTVICRTTPQQVGDSAEPLRTDLPLEVCPTKSQQVGRISARDQVLSVNSLVARKNCLSLSNGYDGMVLGNLSLSEFSTTRLFVSGYIEVAKLYVNSDILIVSVGDLMISSVSWGNQPASGSSSNSLIDGGARSLYLYSITGSVKLPAGYANLTNNGVNQGVIKVVQRLSDVPESLRRGLFAPPPPLGIILSL